MGLYGRQTKGVERNKKAKVTFTGCLGVGAMSPGMKSSIALIMEQCNSVTRRGKRNEPRTMLKVTRINPAIEQDASSCKVTRQN